MGYNGLIAFNLCQLKAVVSCGLCGI